MNSLEDLCALVERVTQKDGPQLYRDLYGLNGGHALRVESWDDWNSLPFLTKSVLETIPMWQRTFTPWSELDSIHASSGTAGKPPLFSPRVRLDGYEYRTRFHTFTKPALCSTPIHHQHEYFLRQQGAVSGIVVLDPRRARASVELARLAGVDSLFVFTGHLMLVGAEIERLGMGGEIRFVELTGEACSRALYRYARRVFPNAIITSVYGASELEVSPMSYPCRPFGDDDPLELHHPKPNYYVEFVDSQTGKTLPIEKDVEGELVLTTSVGEAQHPLVSPLIRYRIGDMARVVDAHCPDHGTWSFVVLGRAEMDFVKIPGGMLRGDEVERALSSLGVSDIFELHYAEREDEGTLKVALTVRVEAAPGAHMEELARRLEKNLRVGPSFTYADGIERGLYLPIICVPFAGAGSTGKRKRIVRDA